MESQNHRFAGSAARATAASRKATDNPNGPLGGDYARDPHRGGLGDDYARDGGFSGGGNHEDYVRDPDSVKPTEGVPSTAHDSESSPAAPPATAPPSHEASGSEK